MPKLKYQLLGIRKLTTSWSTVAQIHRPQNQKYENSVYNHGARVQITPNDFKLATMCPPTSDKTDLLHWKCALYCCSIYSWITIPKLDLDSANNTITI